MGNFYIVATPIGNLGDISFRAIDILKNVDYILSEDTRETLKILEHYNIDTPQISYRDQNHQRILKKILNLLDSNKELALVSDSGTPLISDPGFKLVRELVKRQYKVLSVPGPSAAIAALSISGLPTDKFIFLGFLPKKKNQRKSMLEKYGNLDCTLTIYESPYRLKGLLQDIFEVLGDRRVCVAKDLTKKYEEVSCNKISILLQNLDTIKPKGEYVVLIAKETF